VSILGDNIATVQQASSHIFAVAGIAFNHLVVGLKTGHGDLLDRVYFVRGLSSRDNWRVSHKGEVNARIWHKVGLELVEIDVEGTIETK
jgi:hypothetical protein